MTEDKIFTTLAQIRACSPCEDGYKRLCKSLGGVRKYGANTPVTFRQIYDCNGYNDTLWCLRTTDSKWFPLWRHFACDAADDVRHLMTDECIAKAIDVARLHADGKATYKELAAARTAAQAAAWTAAQAAAQDAAWAAAWTAAQAAAWAAAQDAAQDAARDAAWAAARDAARDAAWAAARDAAWAAAQDAAQDAARDAQMERLFKYCAAGERIK